MSAKRNEKSVLKELSEIYLANPKTPHSFVTMIGGGNNKRAERSLLALWTKAWDMTHRRAVRDTEGRGK
jgi:hypothetical protein